MIQPNQMKEFTIALVRWPNGLAKPAQVSEVKVQARTVKEAKRLAKQQHSAGFAKVA
jgi:hypothetical protein